MEKDDTTETPKGDVEAATGPQDASLGRYRATINLPYGIPAGTVVEIDPQDPLLKAWEPWLTEITDTAAGERGDEN